MNAHEHEYGGHDETPLMSRGLALVIVGALLSQTVAALGAGVYAVWWGSGITTKVDSVIASQERIRAEGYTRVENQLQLQRLDMVDNGLLAKYNDLQAEVKRIDTLCAQQFGKK